MALPQLRTGPCHDDDVVIAIIPAAGLGTRMAALTKGAPKELLPLGRRTVLERVIDEAIRAGADATYVVSSPEKLAIDRAVAEWGAGKFRDGHVRVVHQREMLGLIDAVLTPMIIEDALILLGDCVFAGSSPTERMANLIYRGIDGCIAVETVNDEEVRRYGICEVDDMGTIRKMLEKPYPEETSSRWAVAARYAFSAQVMASLADWYLRERTTVASGEISLTAGIQNAMREGFEFKAVALSPEQERVDCGTPEEYESARRKAWD